MGAAEDPPFVEPRLAINRVYTRRGDAGTTSLVDGKRLDKDARRIEAYGTVDELNAQLGKVAVTLRQAVEQYPRLKWLQPIVLRVQHELFNLGSLLATTPAQVGEKQPRVTPAAVERLEGEIDRANAELPPLRSFVLPGASPLSAELHICRTVCRRAERICVAVTRDEPATDPTAVAYLNRLSDAFFVWSRWADWVQEVDELLWDPNV